MSLKHDRKVAPRAPADGNLGQPKSYVGVHEFTATGLPHFHFADVEAGFATFEFVKCQIKTQTQTTKSEETSSCSPRHLRK